jgi:hypothetical protein
LKELYTFCSHIPQVAGIAIPVFEYSAIYLVSNAKNLLCATFFFPIGMTNRFFQTLKFYPAGFYGREIYGKFVITGTRHFSGH